MENEKPKITKEMTIGELLDKYPDAAQVLWEKGLMCVMCHLAKDETLEAGAKAHGINVNELIEELNKVIK